MADDKQQWIDLKAARLSALGVERERSCVTLPELFECAENLPEGLTLEVATDWFWCKPARVKRAHYDYLLGLWRNQPDEPDNRIPLIEEMYLALAWHRERTGVGPMALLENAPDIPEGLNGRLIQNWLHTRRSVKTVKSHYYLYVIELWASLPDASPAREPEDGCVALTDTMRRHLQEERLRTGISLPALLADRRDLPEGLTPAIAASWMRESEPTRSARPEHYAYVLQLWQVEPDDPDPRIPFTAAMRRDLEVERTRTGVGPTALVALARPGSGGLSVPLIRHWLQTRRPPISVSQRAYGEALVLWRSLPDDPRVLLTAAMRLDLRHEYERTGVSPSRLLHDAADCPDDLNANTVRAWLAEGAKTIQLHPGHLNYVLGLWRQLPESPYVRLTDDLRRQIEAEKRRTGIGTAKLMPLIDPLPAGLNANLVNSWLYGRRKRQTASRVHLEAVLQAWKALPDDPYIPITDEIRRELIAEKERSGLGPDVLLGRTAEKGPTLSPSTVTSWLTGRATRARTSHLEHVRRLWATATDRPEIHHVALTEGLLKELRRLRQRTGLGPQAILRGSKDRPEGLTSRVIADWLKGEAKSACPAHLDYVLQRWQTAPTRVRFTPAMRDELKNLRERTGVGPKELLQGARDLPPGLRPTTVDAWLRGVRKEIYREHYDTVVRLWQQLDKEGARGDRIPLDHGRIEALQRERERSGIGPTRLLRQAADLPRGLTANMVTNWLMGQNRKARRDHYDFVLSLWKSLPSKNRGEPSSTRA